MDKQVVPNRKKMPSYGKPVQLKLQGPEAVLLDNGMEAFLINAGEEPVTRLDVVIKAGTAYQQKKLVAGSVGKMIREGTKHYTSNAIAEILDSRGAFMDVSVTKDSAVLTLYALNKYLDDLIPLVADMLAHAEFMKDELNIHISRERQEFLVNSEKVRYKAMLEFNRMVFGKDSVYGQVLEIDDFDHLTRNDLLTFYKNRYVAGNAYIILSGKVDDNVLALVNKFLGIGWSKTVTNHQKIKYNGTIPEKSRYIKKEGSMQSAIRVGRPIIGKTHPDYNRFVLLNTILGGYFGSRLMSNLREDKGYTYGVSSFVANYVHGSFFSVSTEVNAKFTRDALDQIHHEMTALRTRKVGDEELQLVKNYIYGTFLRNFDGPFALAERFRSAKDFNLDFEFYRNSLKEILAATSDDLLETAEKYFDPGQMINLVVGMMEGS
ncbi:MAG TPA: insulinase family protein [Bacteroidetes bacterium]|nr:insulinase family protein [Bacteroidota bacterium]